MNRDGWGAVLWGDPAEIEDWKHCLGNMFDPWVEQVDNDVVLRSSSFDNIQTAEELRDVARILIDVLNGALSIDQNTRRVEFGGAIEFRAGAKHRTVFAEMDAFECRAKCRATAVVKDANGNVVTQAPQPSAVQRWSSAAQDDELLEDALIFFGRATDWFDLYKCLECLILRHGSEREFFAWAGAESRARGLKITANWHRHAPKKYERPANLVSYGDARSVLSALLSRALSEAV